MAKSKQIAKYITGTYSIHVHKAQQQIKFTHRRRSHVRWRMSCCENSPLSSWRPFSTKQRHSTH